MIDIGGILIIKLIKNKNGDTLAETLVSVLIVSLASALLASMIGAASRMNLKAKEYDGQLDDAVITMTSAEIKQPVTVNMGENLSWSVQCKTTRGGNNSAIVLSSYEYALDTTEENGNQNSSDTAD